MRYLLCVFIPLLLTACSKPPGCADPKVVDLAKQIIEDNIIKKADPDGLKRMQVGLSLITEEGYNSDISKWACSGQVTLQTSPETLKVVNDEIDLIRNITHPNATQALALGLFRMAGKKVLTDEEERLTFALEARGWKPYTQEELKASINFSSQFEAGSKNLIVGVNSAAGLNQFPQLTRLGFARQQQAAAQADIDDDE